MIECVPTRLSFFFSSVAYFSAYVVISMHELRRIRVWPSTLRFWTRDVLRDSMAFVKHWRKEAELSFTSQNIKKNIIKRYRNLDLKFGTLQAVNETRYGWVSYTIPSIPHVTTSRAYQLRKKAFIFFPAKGNGMLEQQWTSTPPYICSSPPYFPMTQFRCPSYLL